MTDVFRTRDEIAAELGDWETEITAGTIVRTEVRWDDEPRLYTALPFAIPADRVDEVRPKAEQLCRDWETGRFVFEPQLAFEVVIARRPDGGIDRSALGDALMSVTFVIGIGATIERWLQKPLPPPPPSVVRRASTRLTADELARVRAACDREWPAFRHRLDGALMCYVETQPWWRNHRVVEVQAVMPMPATGIAVVFNPHGEVRVLRGHPEHIASIARVDPPPPLTDEAAAREYAMTCASWTTDAQWGELPVASFDDIPFRTSLTADEQAAVTRLRGAAAPMMHPLRIRGGRDGFVITLWTVSMSRLIYRELRVPPDGQLHSRQKVLGDVPVPPGKAWGRVGDRFVPVM